MEENLNDLSGILKIPQIPYWYFLILIIAFCIIILFFSIENNNLKSEQNLILKNYNSDLNKMINLEKNSALFAGMTYNTFAYIYESKQADFNYSASVVKEAKNNWELLNQLDDNKFQTINFKFDACSKEETSLQNQMQELSNSSIDFNKDEALIILNKKHSECYALYSQIEDRIYEITKAKFKKRLGLE